MNCGECQNGNSADCQFFSDNVILQCPDDSTVCYYSVLTFTVNRHTSIVLSDSCGLVVKATATVSLRYNSSIWADYINITAPKINLLGELVTSGRGPVDGPGVGNGFGQGGSYGGSGGRISCDQYFSNYDYEIGSAYVLRDPLSTRSGSGGGFRGQLQGGRGGGAVGLRCHTLNITGGIVAADGSKSVVAALGSGSGGSISLLVSASIVGSGGVFSVQGGSADSALGVGGGSGGRIYFESKAATKASLTFKTSGGSDSVLTSINCYAGAAGTYVNYINQGSSLNNAILAINNRDILTYASTVVEGGEVLSSLRGFVLRAKAVAATNAINLVQQCDMSESCSSFIAVDDSRIVSLAEDPLPDSTLTLQADSIELSKGGSVGSAYHLAINAQLVAVDEESTLSFGCVANITSTRYMELLSDINQMYSPHECEDAFSRYTQRGLAVIGQNVSLASARAQNIAINSNELYVQGSFLGVPEEYNLTSCWDAVDTAALSCENFDENSTMQIIPSNDLNYVIIITNTEFSLFSGTTMTASVVLVCAPSIVLHTDSVVSSDGRGCPYNEGYGAGDAPSAEGMGGGGGGFGGTGGAGSSTADGGLTYQGGFNMSVGYGGGVDYDSAPYQNASGGGGLILINGTNCIDFNGHLRASGAHASSDGGGGSGGMVQLFTVFLSGNGSIIVNGGNGGPAGGGGGGGGIINIDNLGTSTTYRFEGIMDYNGGDVLIESQNTDKSTIYPETGSPGIVGWPLCDPGYGNNYATFQMCYKCPVDYYKMGYNGNECKKCDNKPDHSDYTTPGSETKECHYKCDNGFVGDDCLPPFEKFIDGMGGYPAFGAAFTTILVVVFAPLLILRMRKKNRQQKIMKDSESSNSQVFGNMMDFHEEKSSEWLNPVLDESLLTSKNLSREDEPPNSPVTSSTSSSTKMGGILRRLKDGATFPELRALSRMADKDLPIHAARVYLWGNNSPFATDGGPWYWPQDIPRCLADMISANDYSNFAEYANSLLHWDALGWEAVMFGVICVFFPPYADAFMMRCRLKRAKEFIHITTGCNHKFFRSNRQRAMLNSIRAGVSPDLTVAYVDFLFDEGHNSPERPLNHIGQPRFPITLRICGLGTYFSPWYIDTNDVVMQAISQSHEIGVFIDKAWVNFVVELNNHLRTVRIHRIHRDLPRLLQFLNDERLVGGLGGIVVHFCSFVNTLHAAASRSTDGAFATAPEASTCRSEASVELPEARPGELTEFSTASQQPLPGTFLGFFGDHRRNSGDSIVQKADSGAAGEDSGRVTFGRNSTSLKKHYFSDMFASDEEQGKSSPHMRETSRNEASQTRHCDANTLHRFSDVCNAVASGLRLPGIVIFHESTPLEYVLNNDMVDVVMDTSWAKKKDNVDVDEPDRDSLISVDLAGNARNAYGERAEELAKFYKIVRTADKTAEGRADGAGADDKSVTETAIVDIIEPAPRSALHDQDEVSPSHSKTAVVPRQVSFSAPVEEDGRSVEMVISVSSQSLEDMKESRTDMLSPFSGDHSRGRGEDHHVLSSGHLHPVEVWKWGDGNSALRLTMEEESNESDVSTFYTLFYMVVATLGLQEISLDMKRGRPVFIGMDEKTAHRAYKAEVIITSVALASRLFCNGSNHKPLSATFRRIVGLVLCLFNVVDFALTCFISINLWCIWGDPTDCDNHSGFILSMLIWPGALVLAPLYGLYAAILTPTGRFARQYSCWSRLAFFSLITLYSIYLSFVRHAPLETLFYLLALTTSRVGQICLVDRFIACHENMRINRGWDGVFTNIVRDEYYFE